MENDNFNVNIEQEISHSDSYYIRIAPHPGCIIQLISGVTRTFCELETKTQIYFFLEKR